MEFIFVLWAYKEMSHELFLVKIATFYCKWRIVSLNISDNRLDKVNS